MKLAEVRERVKAIAHWIDVDLELPVLYRHLAATEPGDVYLEVGTGQAGCSAAIAALSTVAGVEVWTVDDGSFWRKNFGLSLSVYAAQIQASLKRLGVANKVGMLLGDSAEVRWDGKPIALLFIDDAHEYECVVRDITRWTPCVPPEGIVIFHDCTTHPGVIRAVNELMRAGGWQELEAGGSLCVFRREEGK